MSTVGTLHLHVLEAHLTHDVKLIGKMDPYVAVVVRDYRWKTNADKNGSKKPVWHGQHTAIDVKYLGDDIYFKVFDEDKGKDELVGSGSAKISTFCAQKESDLWIDLEFKGKDAGKVHFKSTWEPKEAEHSKEDHNDLIAQAQETIKVLVARKHELEQHYEQAKETKEAHEATHEARLAAVSGEADLSHYNGAVAAANAQYEETIARINHERKQAEDSNVEVEARIAEHTHQASEIPVHTNAEVARIEAEIEAEKARRAEAREAERNAHNQAKEAKLAAIKEENRVQYVKDEEAHEKVADEIREIAQKLLAINQQIQDKLVQLTNL